MVVKRSGRLASEEGNTMNNTYAGRQAEAAERTANLPELVGSERQIAWANEIRASLMDYFTANNEQMEGLFAELQMGGNLPDKDYATFINAWKAETESWQADAFINHKFAAWWIRHSQDCLAVINREWERSHKG